MHNCTIHTSAVHRLHITEYATCKAACGPEIWRDSSVILGEERLDENLAAASVQHVWVHWARLQSAGRVQIWEEHLCSSSVQLLLKKTAIRPRWELG